MALLLYRVHPMCLMNMHSVPASHKPLDQTSWLGLWVHPWAATVHTHHHRLLLLLTTHPESWYLFYYPVEGWVDLGTAVRVCNLCPRLYIAVSVVIQLPQIWSWVRPGAHRTLIPSVKEYLWKTFCWLSVYCTTSSLQAEAPPISVLPPADWHPLVVVLTVQHMSSSAKRKYLTYCNVVRGGPSKDHT